MHRYHLLIANLFPGFPGDTAVKSGGDGVWSCKRALEEL